MRYRVHPSPTLVTTFSNRPFQGQDPNEAKVFFFGIDANYAANVEDNAEFFNILLAYHGNGVAYWQNNENNDHHPFLLPMYREGAGYSYHKTIKGIDLPAETCATAISFVEMLNVPTTGSLNEDPGHVFDHLTAAVRLAEPLGPQQTVMRSRGTCLLEVMGIFRKSIMPYSTLIISWSLCQTP